MGGLRYIGLVLTTAFRHSFTAAQNVVFGLLIVVGLVAWFVPPIKAAMTKAEIDMSGWQVATIVLGGIVLIRLFLAPYWIYKEQLATIKSINQKLRNKLTKRQLREQIAAFMDEGRTFLVIMTRDRVIPKAAVREWDEKVKVWLTENLDASYKTKFLTARSHPEPPTALEPEALRINWIGTRFRIDNLGLIMDEFR